MSVTVMSGVSKVAISLPEDAIETPRLTIDELAQRVGMTVRNLREWRTLGLLPPAEMRGRTGYYDASVEARIKGIQKLHADGFTLELIRRMLETSGESSDEVTGVKLGRACGIRLIGFRREGRREVVDRWTL